ncbi:hypothetical protein M422DRAFT_254069 [Sphaerobolus stellatus SS14]|uniref:Uncharacterized protein n=1 Tax=Sphaerobolus stellatus (strain SS14) TaxID=990650 RepID=A0A0C9VWC8_SPHS4|nr:hypothetical protein M422DRAFT_254069 [Sphaerobolus stellatus SS14]
MGCISKAKRAHIQNLKNPSKPPVGIDESALQDENKESDTECLPGLDIQEESEGEEVDEDAEPEVHNDATFLAFASQMQEAQRLLEAQEHEAKALRKRPKQYLKTSEQAIEISSSEEFSEVEEVEAEVFSNVIDPTLENTNIKSQIGNSAGNGLTAQEKFKELLRAFNENDHSTQEDDALSGLCWKDFPALQNAKTQLSEKAKDKKLDVVFRARITAMVATLNFYLLPDLQFTWRQASYLAARAAGKSEKFGRNVRQWIYGFLRMGTLPLHRYCQGTTLNFHPGLFSTPTIPWELFRAETVIPHFRMETVSPHFRLDFLNNTFADFCGQRVGG